jgi:hypothetical protein
MLNDSIFTGDLAWSKRKYNLLSGYLTHLTNHRPKAIDQLYCVDAFAGGGPFDNRLPIPTLRRAADPFSKGARPLGVKFIKVATNHSKGGSERPSDFGTINTASGPFAKLFPNILSIVGNKPAMLFLNPGGPPPVALSSLKPILQRKQVHTELIVKFDAEVLWRAAVESCVTHCGHTNRCSTAVKQIAKILGVQTMTDISCAGPAAALVGNYVARIAEFGFVVVAYRIRDELSLPTNSFLIYCTRRHENVWLMNNLIRATEDALLKEAFLGEIGRRGNDAVATDLFLRRQELKHLVLDYGQRVQPTNVKAIEFHFAFERFGEFHEQDFKAVIDEIAPIGV